MSLTLKKASNLLIFNKLLNIICFFYNFVFL